MRMAKFPHAAALGSLGAFAIERGRSLGNDLGIYRCRHVVTPFLISCLELFLFLFFSTSLKQTGQRTIHISSRESERDPPHCHISIHLLIYPSSSCPTRSYYENIPIRQFTILTTNASNASAFLTLKKNGFDVLQVCPFIHSDVNNFLVELLLLPNKIKHSLSILFFFKKKRDIKGNQIKS